MPSTKTPVKNLKVGDRFVWSDGHDGVSIATVTRAAFLNRGGGHARRPATVQVELDAEWLPDPRWVRFNFKDEVEVLG